MVVTWTFNVEVGLRVRLLLMVKMSASVEPGGGGVGAKVASSWMVAGAMVVTVPESMAWGGMVIWLEVFCRFAWFFEVLGQRRLLERITQHNKLVVRRPFEHPHCCSAMIDTVAVKALTIPVREIAERLDHRTDGEEGQHQTEGQAEHEEARGARPLRRWSRRWLSW